MKLSWTAAISMTIPERPKSLGPNRVLTLAASVGRDLGGAVVSSGLFDARSSKGHLSPHGRRLLSCRVRRGPPFFHLAMRAAARGAVSLFSRRRERRSASRPERNQRQTRHSHHRGFVRGGLLDCVRGARRDGLRVGNGAKAMEPCFF